MFSKSTIQRYSVKPIQTICQQGIMLLVLLYSVSAPAITESSVSKDLIGTWQCKAEFIQSGIRVFFNSTDTFTPLGKVSSEGVVNILFNPNLPQVTYKSLAAGTWLYQQPKLKGQMTDLQLINISHPELDLLFNPKAMLPKLLDGEFIIKTLSSKTMALASAGGEIDYQCTR